MPNYKATIKVNKLDKSAFFKSQNGDTFCSVILWENRDGTDQYGNTHSIKQDLGKERKGERSEYVGNAKTLGGQTGRDRTPADAYKKPDPQKNDFDKEFSEDDIPF